MFRKVLGTILMSMILVLIVGCSEGIDDPGNSLFFIPIVDTGAYWSNMRTGAERMADELGWNLVVRTTAPTANQKNERHLAFVQEAISHGVAGIALAPMDPDMFDQIAAQAMDADIPVITFDADVATYSNRTSYVGTDNLLAGEYLGMRGAQFLQDKGITQGSIAMVAVNLSQTTMVNRMEGIRNGFNDQMGELASQFTWIAPIADDDQASVSMQQLEGQIVGNPDMVAVFSLGSEGPVQGTMQALRSQARGGEIHHFGFDFTPSWLEGVEEGLIVGIVNQDAYTIGRQVVQTMVDAVEGRTVQDNYPISVEWVWAEDLEAYGEIILERMGQETIEDN